MTIMSTSLEKLLPEGAKAFLLREEDRGYYSEDHLSLLTSEEKRSCAYQTESRLLEFARGRYCLHRTLQSLECDAPLLRGESGRVILPDGVSGSISHTSDICIAVATKDASIHGLGVDVESSKHSIIPELAVPEDSSSSRIEKIAKFSAKESLYKAWEPLVQRFLWFTDVSVFLNDGELEIVFNKPEDRRELEDRGLEPVGKYVITDTHIYTAVWFKEKENA